MQARLQEPADEESPSTAGCAEGAARAARPAHLLNQKAGEPRGPGLPMKWVSLVALTLQTTAQVLFIKYARASGGRPYLSSTAVFLGEVVKTLASLCLVVQEAGSPAEAVKAIREQIFGDPVEMLKAVVPSLLYTLQNNLMFYSLEKLSAAEQQVLYQMKIISTAGLGVLFLGKPLSATKWTAVFMLATGVAMVQWPRNPEATMPFSTHIPESHDAGLPDLRIRSDQLKGFLAVLVACFTSGFAAVYIQKMLQQTTQSIWMRNVQFGSFGTLISLLVVFGQDGNKVMEGGLTQGYSWWTVTVVFTNAIGGLLCAAVLRYAGAVLGCFSTALSIVLTCFCSYVLLDDFVPDELFVMGAVLAVGASLLFGLGVPGNVREALNWNASKVNGTLGAFRTV